MPGRYVGAETQEDDGEPFDEKMKRLTAMPKLISGDLRVKVAKGFEAT